MQDCGGGRLDRQTDVMRTQVRSRQCLIFDLGILYHHHMKSKHWLFWCICCIHSTVITFTFFTSKFWPSTWYFLTQSQRPCSVNAGDLDLWPHHNTKSWTVFPQNLNVLWPSVLCWWHFHPMNMYDLLNSWPSEFWAKVRQMDTRQRQDVKCDYGFS